MNELYICDRKGYIYMIKSGSKSLFPVFMGTMRHYESRLEWVLFHIDPNHGLVFIGGISNGMDVDYRGKLKVIGADII